MDHLEENDAKIGFSIFYILLFLYYSESKNYVSIYNSWNLLLKIGKLQ